MKHSRILVTAATLSLALLSAPAGAEGPAQGDAPDTRTPLHLDPAAREEMLGTMREHLETLQAVVAALAQGKYGRAQDLAHEELGFPKHHRVMMREGNVMYPPRYSELAMAHHKAAEDLARAIAAREMPAILQRLDETIAACTACHRAFRLADD
jgi:hypothetical protein